MTGRFFAFSAHWESHRRQSVQRERTPTRAFNAALMGTCVTAPTEVALGCLGIIEYVFADISSLIGQEVVARGSVSSQQLVLYKLHAEIDNRTSPFRHSQINPHRFHVGGVTPGMKSRIRTD